MQRWLVTFVILLVVIGVGASFLKKTRPNSNGSSTVPPAPADTFSMEQVTFKTEDGVDIVADYYSREGARFGAILLHMMPKDRTSWEKFAKKLNEAGYAALAVDFRGHGESTNSPQGSLDYRKFTDAQHQASVFDIQAASAFLKSKGFQMANQFLVGASIGANLSLRFLSEHPDVRATVLLSPGLNYRGIEMEGFVRPELGKKLLVAASSDDGGSTSPQAASRLKELMPDAKLVLYQRAGHGTDMFGKEEPDLSKEIVSWLKEVLI